jgi:hypothetical protein
VSRFAYADPPYLGLGEKLYGKHHPDAAEWDRLETHAALIERLTSVEFDGWALSLHVPSLRALLPLVPEEARVCAWVKPWARMHPGARQQYTWEPVIVQPVRKPKRSVRDYVSANATMLRGMPGAKPDEFAMWLFAFAGLRPDDELVDLFPGSGAVSSAWDRWRSQITLDLPESKRAALKRNLEAFA